MSNIRAITVQAGIMKQQQDADTLIVGAGITTSSGNLAITSAGGTVSINEATSIGSGFALSSVGGAANFDWSASSGSFKTSTGAGTLTFGAASTLSTTTGALTVTSAAAATWSTSAGILTINGTAGITMQGGAVSALIINSAGTAITVQAGATLAATGTGNINVPNNASARFQIEGSSVSANVTSANLGTLTAGSGSVADALHTHTSVSGALAVTVSGLTTTNMTSSGQWGYISSNNTLSKTDNAAIGTAKAFGVYEGTSGQMILDGVVGDSQFTTAGGSPSAGSFAYLAAAADDSSAGAGKLTATVPSSGIVAPVAIVLDNSNYASAKTCKILMCIEDPVIL